ncbi:MAG: hypothetical protein GY799_07765 [Desulfobulbaceae bacterium]|nr:hypothetical protein [Desulfobulbaceae bacterium]
MTSWYTPFFCKYPGFDTYWSYTLFFAFSAAGAASFSQAFHHDSLRSARTVNHVLQRTSAALHLINGRSDRFPVATMVITGHTVAVWQIIRDDK